MYFEPPSWVVRSLTGKSKLQYEYSYQKIISIKKIMKINPKVISHTRKNDNLSKQFNR